VRDDSPSACRRARIRFIDKHQIRFRQRVTPAEYLNRSELDVFIGLRFIAGYETRRVE
jgi:hypothetical protein